MPTEDGGYIEFTTPMGAQLDLKVYSAKTNDWVTAENGKYQVDRNGTYIIGVPLNQGSYPAGSKLGFLIDKDPGTTNKTVDMFAVKLNLYAADKTKVLERHTIMMIRRVLYHTK